VGGATGLATTEHTANDAIAQALRPTRHGWNTPGVVRSEHTQTLTGNNKRPDILVTEAGVSPVVIETEFLPAITVEPEARDRLGETLKENGRKILSSIAVRTPMRMKGLAGTALAEAIAAADDFEFALFTGDSPTEVTRWPKHGWMKGTITDLSILAQAATVPPAIVEQAADQLMIGVQQAAGHLAGIEEKNPIALDLIAKALCQEDSDQTRVLEHRAQDLNSPSSQQRPALRPANKRRAIATAKFSVLGFGLCRNDDSANESFALAGTCA
jgi:hypothetical protein